MDEDVEVIPQYVEITYCPHGCGALRWVRNHWHCPQCKSDFKE